MIKKLVTDDLYRKMKCPDLCSIIYLWINGKKVYGKVEYINFFGKQGHVNLGISPFKKVKNNYERRTKNS